MKKFLYIAGAVLIVATGAAAFLLRPAPPPQQTQAAATPEPPKGVSSRGRIQAETDPVVIGARSLSGQPSVISQLRVKEGEYLKAGQIIATLDSLPQLEAYVVQAEDRVKVAEARLKQVKAGGRSPPISPPSRHRSRGWK
jgi:HlyD family secretion protein